jgi:hypothetical protein
MTTKKILHGVDKYYALKTPDLFAYWEHNFIYFYKPQTAEKNEPQKQRIIFTKTERKNLSEISHINLSLLNKDELFYINYKLNETKLRQFKQEDVRKIISAHYAYKPLYFNHDIDEIKEININQSKFKKQIKLLCDYFDKVGPNSIWILGLIVDFRIDMTTCMNEDICDFKLLNEYKKEKKISNMWIETLKSLSQKYSIDFNDKKTWKQFNILLTTIVHQFDKTKSIQKKKYNKEAPTTSPKPLSGVNVVPHFENPEQESPSTPIPPPPPSLSYSKEYKQTTESPKTLEEQLKEKQSNLRKFEKQPDERAKESGDTLSNILERSLSNIYKSTHGEEEEEEEEENEWSD